MRHATVLAATLVCVTAAPTALAQVATWNGGNGNWTDQNWVINGLLSRIPHGPQVTAIIPEGAPCLNGVFQVGDVRLTGTGNLCGGGPLTISGDLIQDAGTLGAGVFLDGPGSLWTGGSWRSVTNRSTTLRQGAGLQISVSGVADLTGRTLSSSGGAITHRGGDIGGDSGTAIGNIGTWTEIADVPLEFLAIDPAHTWTFRNGTFTKLGPSSTTFTRVRFDMMNGGSVDVQEGTLNLNGGGTAGSSALFNAEPGAAINFGDTTYTVNGNAFFTGDGQFTAIGGFRMNGIIEASNLTFDGATIGGSHWLSGPNFLWTGDNIGTFAEGGITTLTSGSSMEIDVTGTVDLTRHTLSNIGGAVTHRGGRIGGDSATSVVNRGTWTEIADVPLEFLAFDPTHDWTYTNNGTFTKQGPASTTFNISFSNTWTIDVQGGILDVARSFTQTAGEMILSGGDVAGALTFTGGSLRGSGSLAGDVSMTGAVLDPGTPAGLLDFGANLALNLARVPIQLQGTSRGTTYDAIDVAGSLALGGSTLQLDATLLDPATPIGTEFLIFNKASAPAISGTFRGLAQGAGVASGIFVFELTYLGGDGNDIVLTVSASSFCYADCDGNGTLDIFDFLCFQNSFVSGEPYACDCDLNPVCNIFDFLCFQTAFVTGCP